MGSPAQDSVSWDAQSEHSSVNERPKCFKSWRCEALNIQVRDVEKLIGFCHINAALIKGTLLVFLLNPVTCVGDLFMVNEISFYILCFKLFGFLRSDSNISSLTRFPAASIPNSGMEMFVVLNSLMKFINWFLQKRSTYLIIFFPRDLLCNFSIKF